MLKMTLHNDQGAWLGDYTAVTIEDLKEQLTSEWSDPQNITITINGEDYIYYNDELMTREDYYNLPEICNN